MTICILTTLFQEHSLAQTCACSSQLSICKHLMYFKRT